jgi:hypothetical protein
MFWSGLASAASVLTLSSGLLVFARWRQWTFRQTLATFILVLVALLVGVARSGNWGEARVDPSMRVVAKWAMFTAVTLLTGASIVGLSRRIFWAAILLVPLLCIWVVYLMFWSLGDPAGIVGAASIGPSRSV